MPPDFTSLALVSGPSLKRRGDMREKGGLSAGRRGGFGHGTMFIKRVAACGRSVGSRGKRQSMVVLDDNKGVLLDERWSILGVY